MKTTAVHPAPGSARSPQPASRQRAGHWLRRAMVLLAGMGSHGARYPLIKLYELETYRATTSYARAAAVIVLTPLPALLGTVLLSAIPLQDPALGILRNYGFLLHLFCLMSLAAFGTIVPPLRALRLPTAFYSMREVVAVCALASTQALAAMIGLARVWRFPMPFSVVVLVTPWTIALVLSHALVLRGRILRGNAVRGPLFSTLPWLVIEGSQIVLYPAISALFERLPELGQVLLTLCFPLAKYALKRTLRLLGFSVFRDESAEMAVTSVEISASLYQSMIMQTAPSVLATAIIISVDVLQGLMSVKLFLDKPVSVPHNAVIETALTALQAHSIDEQALSRHEADCSAVGIASPTQSAWSETAHKTTTAKCAAPRPSSAPAAPRIPEQDKLVVLQALETLHSAEIILLIEYFEVAVPIVNAVFIAVASHTRSARYNAKLWQFHEDRELLSAALRSLALYSLLQGLSVVAMALVMRRRYRLSAMKHLAFVLERHAWSIQCKLLAWLPIILNFSLVHYGVDFTFKFVSAATSSALSP